MSTKHWTQDSPKAFLYRVATDFVIQIEDVMAQRNISQAALAQKLKITPGRVSQIINNPGNLRLDSMLEIARALGLKITIVAYENDDDSPVNARYFKHSWECCGRPETESDLERVRFRLTEIDNHNIPFDALNVVFQLDESAELNIDLEAESTNA